MKDYIKTLRDWRKLARPNKWYVLITFVAIILSQVCVLVSPTFEAKTTIAITSGDYTGTKALKQNRQILNVFLKNAF